ncbi:MAG: Na+/H+ antiporter NhaC family protein [Sedimentisphaerales bacterium]|nr:Na+/H+ antiporter NhaC family protein [Sedimentisphaerales bacterium]
MTRTKPPLNRRTIVRYAVAAAFIGVLCVFAQRFAPPDAGPWYSIIPPVLAITLAFLTRHVALSLGIAILTGGVLSCIGGAPLNIWAWLEGFKTAGWLVVKTVKPFSAGGTVNSNLMILAFLPPVFIMIEVIIASGGFSGIVRWLLKHVRGAKSAQLATALMGLLCFIDDYANAIIVGSMMQPITDRFRVSREKLAFIVDATSAPVAGLAVISTWIAYEVGLLTQISDQLNLGRSGYSMFFDALSFRFYCLLMIAFVLLHIILSRDFGPMKKAENAARTEPGQDEDADSTDQSHSNSLAIPHHSQRAIKALIPLGGLILFHLTGLWIDGGGPARLHAAASLLSLSYWRDVISAAEHTHFILDCAGLFGLALALLCSRFYGRLDTPVLKHCFKRGLKRAMIPFVILILAWSLKNSCDGLGTGKFLTALLAGRISPQWFAPAVFLVASLTSFATGTSYGTMAILIPTAVPVAFALDGDTYGPTTMITLGAVLDGAIFGDHCSPISDTTIMSSIATSCDLMRHVRTQLPYSIFVALLALLCAYLPSSLGLPALWSFTLALLAMTLTLLALTRREKPATSR